MIGRFAGEWRFLSNFFPAEVEYMGVSYPTVEHAYQAAKCADASDRAMIRNLSSPGNAKSAGYKVKVREGWRESRVDIMRELLRQKFRDPTLGQRLLDTGDEKLVEGNFWHDRFWGAEEVAGELVGENWLGRLLMDVRAEIRTRRQ